MEEKDSRAIETLAKKDKELQKVAVEYEKTMA